MTLLMLLAYAGGVLTILSPCILPVLPFVFANADRPFLSSGLPQLLGMAASFSLVAMLATAGGALAVEANQYGRVAALGLLALFALTLLFPALAERIMRPLAHVGGGLAQRQTSGFFGSILLGVATGLLWAPCAGPILGLILTGAALGGARLSTLLLLLAYALGAATSLALALLFGGRVFTALKRHLGWSEAVRRMLGAAILAAVGVIAVGLDTGVLATASLASTNAIEQSLLEAVGAAPALEPAKTGPTTDSVPVAASQDALAIEGEMPELSGVVQWLNSAPLTRAQLKGKVVLIDFWTYSCVNCLRALPYVRAWAEKYRDQGLVVIGVHAPEFAFEKSIANVTKAVGDLKIDYPVAIDNDYAVWKAFGNQYWPAHYFIDAQGRIRHHHFGEGDYDGSERVIRRLLSEAGRKALAPDVTPIKVASDAAAPADQTNLRSQETYIGYDRAEHFASPGGAVGDERHSYERGSPRLNEWSLFGDWTIEGERAQLETRGGGVVFRFHARDVNLVLGPTVEGAKVRFRVTVDGGAPGDDHGVDADESGAGMVSEHRLYQLVRQTRSPLVDRTFEIEFFTPGVAAYAFTFG